MCFGLGLGAGVVADGCGRDRIVAVIAPAGRWMQGAGRRQVDDRVEVASHRGFENQPGRRDVRGLDGGAVAGSDECDRGGVDDRVGAVTELGDGLGVADVADHRRERLEPVELLHGAQLGGVAHERDGLVARIDQGPQGVATGESGGAGDGDSHAGQLIGSWDAHGPQR